MQARETHEVTHSERGVKNGGHAHISGGSRGTWRRGLGKERPGQWRGHRRETWAGRQQRQRGLQPDAPRGAQGALGTGCSSCAGPAEADSPAPAKDKRKRHTLRGRRRPRPLQRSWGSVIPTGAAGGSGDGAPRRTLVRHSDELETLQVPVIRSSRQINHVLSTYIGGVEIRGSVKRYEAQKHLQTKPAMQSGILAPPRTWGTPTTLRTPDVPVQSFQDEGEAETEMMPLDLSCYLL